MPCAANSNKLQIDGTVVIGEGERDEAPMLFIGEKVGNGDGPKVDIAVDPARRHHPLRQGHAGLRCRHGHGGSRDAAGRTRRLRLNKDRNSARASQGAVVDLGMPAPQ